MTRNDLKKQKKSDGRTNGRTSKAGCRVACAWLKKFNRQTNGPKDQGTEVASWNRYRRSVTGKILHRKWGWQRHNKGQIIRYVSEKNWEECISFLFSCGPLDLIHLFWRPQAPVQASPYPTWGYTILAPHDPPASITIPMSQICHILIRFFHTAFQSAPLEQRPWCGWWLTI